MRSSGCELFCSLLMCLKPAVSSCSSLLFPHTRGQALPHFRSRIQGLELGEGISLPLSWLSTWHGSGLSPCCSGVRPWVGAGDLCSAASPLRVFPLQPGVCDPAVLCALPAEKVRMGTLPVCVAPVGQGTGYRWWVGWAPCAL